MVVFLVFLFTLGFLATLITQSLIAGKIRRMLIPLALFILPVAAMPCLVRIDMKLLHSLGQNTSLIQILSLLMISEGILCIWQGMNLIKYHYDKLPVKWHAVFFFLPSSSCIAGVLAAVLLCMKYTAAVDYSWISGICGTGAFTAIIFLSIITRIAVKDWGVRFEIRMLCALLQIVSAAFIPLFINPVAFMGSVPDQSLKTMALFIVFSTVFIVAGILKPIFLRRKIYNGFC